MNASLIGSTTAVTFVIYVLFLIASAQSSPQHMRSEEESLEFLNQHMPDQDRQLLDHGFLIRNVHLAVKAREATPWGSDVPWSLFLNDVLPYAVLNERRDDWREFFFNSLSPLVVETASIEQAASVINARIWKLWNLTFVGGQTPQTMSPFQVLEARNASCTGFSILLVDALRSVGVPARVAGTPEWNDGSGGNHDWVEVWFDQSWHFIDAFDGTKFDEGWFVPSPVKYQLPNSGGNNRQTTEILTVGLGWVCILHRNHSIYASSFQSTNRDVHFPLAWDFGDLSVPGLDVTQWYLDFIDQQAVFDHEKLDPVKKWRTWWSFIFELKNLQQKFYHNCLIASGAVYSLAGESSHKNVLRITYVL